MITNTTHQSTARHSRATQRGEEKRKDVGEGTKSVVEQTFSAVQFGEEHEQQCHKRRETETESEDGSDVVEHGRS